MNEWSACQVIQGLRNDLVFFADSSFNQQERLDIEEKYTSLREEAQGKSKKLKKLEGSVKNLESDVSRTSKCRREKRSPTPSEG